MAPESTPAKPGLSLYANLLDPSNNTATPGTISRAPVVFKQPSENDAQQDDAAKKQQMSAATLRFQPTKRPQISAQKAKARAIASKFSQAPPPPPPSASSTPSVEQTSLENVSARPQQKSTLADWAATEDDDDVNGFYGGEKRQRGGRRKKRKNNGDREAVPQNWDDIYDPSRPSNYEEYKNSEEKISEVREWKDRLYAHRMARRRSSDMDSEEEGRRPQMSSQFAPPSMNFAPPPIEQMETPPPPPPAVQVPNDSTGEDAYARRLRLSQQTQQSSMSITPPPPPPPPPPETAPTPPPAPGQIARALVRYSLPPPPPEIPATEAELEASIAQESMEDPDGGAEEPRSNRPGQQKFAERLLAKYGWTKGSGLGANASGIVNPLRVKVEKQKKKPDSEGGGFATPGGRGTIIGGDRKKTRDGTDDEGKFGAMSEVIRLNGMLNGLDVDAEMQKGEGGIMQEIGEECGEKYGRVERVFIDRQGGNGGTVFVRFTSQLSGLRAVNALEGRIFNGNMISARFYDKEKFETGNYAS